LSRRIPVAGPWITDLEVAYVTEAVSTNWYERAGDFVGRFEEAFAAHTGRRHAISLPSCTSGIHLALCALGVGPGDEVIVPDATWIATSAPVTYLGATPVFADVDPITWCLDVSRLDEVASERTVAVIAVDLYGGMPDYGSLQQWASSRGIALIEDAAEAVGSRWGGHPAGSFGTASVFSFHGSKSLTTGEGGMLVTDDDELAARARILRDHGRPPGDRDFLNTEVAFKDKMSSLQAALGLAQLERLDEIVARKRFIFSSYRGLIEGRATLNAEPEGTFNSYWMVTPLLDEGSPLASADIRSCLNARAIDTRPFFRPLSSLPAYAELPGAREARARNRVSRSLARRGLNLPSALSLTLEEISLAAEAYLEAIR
jgi:perosamine synthetase